MNEGKGDIIVDGAKAVAMPDKVCGSDDAVHK